VAPRLKEGAGKKGQSAAEREAGKEGINKYHESEKH